MCSGLNSPRCPERAPDQRVRLAQPCLTRLSNSNFLESHFATACQCNPAGILSQGGFFHSPHQSPTHKRARRPGAYSSFRTALNRDNLSSNFRSAGRCPALPSPGSPGCRPRLSPPRRGCTARGISRKGRQFILPGAGSQGPRKLLLCAPGRPDLDPLEPGSCAPPARPVEIGPST